MPEVKINTGLPFDSIAQRLSGDDVESYTVRLTRGWTVRFGKDGDPEHVWVDFYYNGNIGRDENYSMSVRCSMNTVDNLFEMAKIKASTDLEVDKAKYKGCYGVAVYRTLCLLRDAEVHKK